MKELGADLGLKIPDLLAERRLADSDARSGACEVALPGDREEIADMAQFHASAKSYRERLFYIFDWVEIEIKYSSSGAFDWTIEIEPEPECPA
jgi:hypothetical protein